MIDPRVRAIYYLCLISSPSMATIDAVMDDREAWEIMLSTTGSIGYNNGDVVQAIVEELVNE